LVSGYRAANCCVARCVLFQLAARSRTTIHGPGHGEVYRFVEIDRADFSDDPAREGGSFARQAARGAPRSRERLAAWMSISWPI
jgi:hypothetical protein